MADPKDPEPDPPARARTGSPDAFDGLFAEHAAALQLYVRHRMGRRLRSAMESLDLVQEVYLQAFRSFQDFQGRDGRDLYRWLCGIANHRMSDERRREAALKRGGREHRIRDGDAPSPLEHARAPGPGPRTIAALREEGTRMEEAFAKLSDRDREVIGLRRLEGLSSHKTATRMGMTPNAVNVLYFRAMKRWRELLDG